MSRYLFLFVSVFLFLSVPRISFAFTMLPVPFTPQAPEGDWSQLWQDACEEASIFMVDQYYSGLRSSKIEVEKARIGIDRIFSMKHMYSGKSLDEDAALMVELINNFLPIEARVVQDPSLEQLKNELDSNHPMILPNYGKYLNNPNFGGSVAYHVVVLTGYDSGSSEFLAHEPGTRHGRNYRYSFETIMNAMHDYRPNNETKNAPRVAVFTDSVLKESSLLDGDRDGLSKEEEIQYGTVLWLGDSDGDGFLDGEEVKEGFSPVIPEKNISNGSLIKTSDHPDVYLLDNGKKRRIVSEKAFLDRDWKWGSIKIVSQGFVGSFSDGEPVQ